MKKNIIKCLAFGSLLLTTSCVDLDQEPQSFLTEEEYINYPQTIETVNRGVTGLYNDLWSGNYDFCCRMLRYNTAAGDIVPQLAKPNNDMIPLYDMNPGAGTVTKDITSMYRNFWKVISSTNKIINGTPIPEGEEGIPYKASIGEARFLRALSYFYLVRIFGDMPKVTNTEESLNTRSPRVPVERIYQEVILPDLEIACTDLPKTSRSGSSDTPSQWAAKALRANVYMTMAGWPLKKTELYAKAAADAKDIIEHSGLNLVDNYKDLWQEELKADPTEHMFALHHKLAVNPSQYGKSFFPSDHKPSGWGDYFASEEFMNAYPNDERKAWNFTTDWQDNKGKMINYKQSANRLPLVHKFWDYNAEPDKKGNISQLSNGLTPVYRFADVLLMYAEASTLATNKVDNLAKECLKRVQKRAGIPEKQWTNTTDPKQFDDAVFAERGWELYAEGKRWFDMVRREKAGELRPDVYNKSFYKANGHYYLPIPMNEVTMAGWKNNPGY